MARTEDYAGPREAQVSPKTDKSLTEVNRLNGFFGTSLHTCTSKTLLNLPPESHHRQGKKGEEMFAPIHSRPSLVIYPPVTAPRLLGKEGSFVPGAADLFCTIACSEVVTRGKQQRGLCIPTILEAAGGA